MSKNDTASGEPRTHQEWGTKSKQAHPDYPLSDDDTKPHGWHETHTDADELRAAFGVSEFDVGDYETYETPLANCLVHDADGRYFGHAGGTNALAVGEKGSGKSTLGLHVALRLMEDEVTIPGHAHPEHDIPDGASVTVDKPEEAVVWRGQLSASEWLPFKKWATLWVPEGVGVHGEWRSEDVRDGTREDATLYNVAREVRTYSDPRDVTEGLNPGTFNVVYPDPLFRGCEEIMKESDYCPEPVPFIDPQSAGPDEEPTPPVHWWFAFDVAKLEYGPYWWTTTIFDECADLAPQSARADDHKTYTKVRSQRKVMAHSRKHYYSKFNFGHHEENVHSKIRRTFQWRFSMPDGTANPAQNIAGSSAPVGFSAIPMYHDMLSQYGPGKGLCWTPTNFTRFTWQDYRKFPEDQDRWLSVDFDTASGGAAP